MLALIGLVLVSFIVDRIIRSFGFCFNFMSAYATKARIVSANITGGYVLKKL